MVWRVVGVNIRNQDMLLIIFTVESVLEEHMVLLSSNTGDVYKLGGSIKHT